MGLHDLVLSSTQALRVLLVMLRVMDDALALGGPAFAQGVASDYISSWVRLLLLFALVSPRLLRFRELAEIQSTKVQG